MAAGGSLINILQIGMRLSTEELAIDCKNGKKEDAEDLSRREGSERIGPRAHRIAPGRTGHAGWEEKGNALKEAQADAGGTARG